VNRRPPRLIARTLAVTFVTVAVILSVVFTVLTVDVRERVRTSETDKLRVAERVFSALEDRRQQGVDDVDRFLLAQRPHGFFVAPELRERDARQGMNQREVAAIAGGLQR